MCAIKRINNQTAASGEDATSSNDVEIQELMSSDSEEEEDDESGDFSDEDETAASANKKAKLKRPDTAKQIRKTKIDETKKTRNLRQQQLEHNLTRKKQQHSNGDEDEIILQTARPRTRRRKTFESDEGSSSDWESAFARNVQTVKVNEPRKLLLEKEGENSTNTNMNTNVYNTNKTDQSNATQRQRAQSDKEKRIAELVSSIKERQKQHEVGRKIFDDIKPVLIGGTIFIGGIILHQLYKVLFK